MQLEQAIEDKFGEGQRSKYSLFPRDCMLVARNFPEHFNKDSVLTVDLSPSAERVSVDTLQDKITRAMASVYDHAPELGGRHAEIRAVRGDDGVL